MSDVEYKSPTSKVFLGSKSKTCAAGEKKLLLLSHIDEMANEHRYKVWVTDNEISVCESNEPSSDTTWVLLAGQTTQTLH